jgi:hypothetical protein
MCFRPAKFGKWPSSLTISKNLAHSLGSTSKAQLARK